MAVKKTLAVALTALTLTGASLTTTSSAQVGFLGNVVADVAGAVVGAAVVGAAESHSQVRYVPVQPTYVAPVQGPVAVPIKECPVGTHIGPQGHYCWQN